MDGHAIVKGYILTLLALGVLANIALIGKERQPITPALAAFMALSAGVHAYFYAKYL